MDTKELPRGCTKIDLAALMPPTRPKSQFGNPAWIDDSLGVSDEVWEGRRDGLREALRLINSGATMTNNVQFQQGMDCVIDLLKRRLAEL